MDLQQLRFLVAISRTLNFSKAAEDLFVSQPTLSYQIRRLEEELGVKLLERSTRNVSLTPIGLECVKLANQVVELTDRITEISQEESRKSFNRLNIGVLAVYPQLNISSVIMEFQSEHLDETIHMHFDWSTALMERLLRKKSDIIISNIDMETIPENIMAQLDINIFLSDRMYLAINENNPLAKRDIIALEEALSQPLFMLGRTSSANLFFLRAVKESGLQMPETTECQSIMNAFNFIQAGNGAFVLSKHVAESYMKPGIKLIRIEPEIKTYTAVITRKELLKRPLVKEFIRFFLKHQK